MILKEGESGVITDCNNTRLLEHGFTPSTIIQMYKKVNGIVSIYIKGAIICLREEEYQQVSIERYYH